MKHDATPDTTPKLPPQSLPDASSLSLEAHRRVRLSGGELEYLDQGQGEPVVMLHPFLTDTRHYRKVAAELAKTHRCVRPLLPLGAHRVALDPDAGNTPLDVARRVAELIEALDLGPVTLVGNDSGGAIAQLVAAHHRHCVAKLVLSNCDAYEVFPPQAFAYLGVVGRWAAPLRITSWLLQRVKWLRHMPLTFGRLSQTKLPDALVQSYVEPLGRADIARDTAKLCASIDPKQTIEAARILSERPLPLRLVWGTADPFFSLSLAQRLARDIAGAELITLPGVMAFVPEDAAPELCAAVRAGSATAAVMGAAPAATHLAGG